MPSGERTWPTALIAGFSMHRFGVGVDPKEDTEKKLGSGRAHTQECALARYLHGVGVHVVHGARSRRRRHHD